MRSAYRIALVISVCVVVLLVGVGVAGPPTTIKYVRKTRVMPPEAMIGDLRIPQCTCVAIAQNLRGATFQGHGPTPERAFEEAMAKCSAASWMTCTCKIISIRAEPCPCAMDPQTSENRSGNIAQEYWRFTITVP